MPDPLTEAQLRAWMERMGPSLIAVSTGICHDRARAEEIVQEAFIKLWRRPPDLGEVVYPAWLRTVVTNLSINALKSRKRTQVLFEGTTDPGLRGERRSVDHVQAREDLRRVERALEKLDPAKRTIIMLRAQDEMAYEDIAKYLGVPVGTVMSRLNRARLALQEELDRMERSDSRDTFDIRTYRKA